MDPARRKRAADGSWRPVAGASSGAGEAPGQAILRLNGLYNSASPPAVSLIRHPLVIQLSSCTQPMQAEKLTEYLFSLSVLLSSYLTGRLSAWLAIDAVPAQTA